MEKNVSNAILFTALEYGFFVVFSVKLLIFCANASAGRIQNNVRFLNKLLHRARNQI